jgi:CheY-like chemotaxis protein
VKNFPEAIEFLRKQHVDLIISDVHLENGGNVFDFLRWVKENPSTKSTPFVLLSSEPTPRAKFFEDGLKTTARLLGAAKYISMDRFDSEEFRKQIDALLPSIDKPNTSSSTGGTEIHDSKNLGNHGT